MPSDQTITRDVVVEEEPEIQYTANENLFEQMEDWVKAKNAKLRKKSEDDAVYYDTKNNRLIREGIECRMKPKGSEWRVDLKVPLDTSERDAVPDENGILWRSELKCRTPINEPRLADFEGQDILEPVRGRVTRLFQKQLLPKFRMVFQKNKYIRRVGDSEIEYAFQRGHIENMQGDQKTDELLIVELELRQGREEDLLTAKKELEAEFMHQGLAFLERRKVVMGFDLIREGMDDKAGKKYDKLNERWASQPIVLAAA